MHSLTLENWLETTNCLTTTDITLNIGDTEKEETKVTGCTIIGDGKDLVFGYLGEDGNVKYFKKIMPNIINVSKPNDETVFVEFADGTKEVAHVNVKEGDTFSMETGVLICVFKKFLSLTDSVEISGSSAYNKIMKYAMTKVDAKKKKREEETKKVKEIIAQINQAERRIKNDKREDRINEMAEAIKRAMKDLYNK